MGLRPGHCYSSTKDRAYSRYAVSVQRKNYLGAVPGLKIRQFNMGNPVKEFSRIVNLVAKASGQIRDNSIESSRLTINRLLIKRLGKDGFFMKIRVYPYQVLRENKQAQGAHADRIQTGMSKAFGKAVGRAARIRPGQILISVLVDEKDVETAKESLKRAKARLNVPITVKVSTDVKSIGTKPRKAKLLEAEKEAEEKEKEEEAKEEGKAEEGKEKEKKVAEEAEAEESKQEKAEEGKEKEKKN